jgi:hypothetical protein
MNKKHIHTRDVSFNKKTGEVTSGMSMSIEEWCDFVFHMASENNVAKEALQTSDSLETYLVDIWELEENDALTLENHMNRFILITLAVTALVLGSQFVKAQDDCGDYNSECYGL